MFGETSPNPAESIGVLVLWGWLLLTLLYNGFRGPMRRVIRPWDVAMLIPGWRLFPGIPRHLVLLVREVGTDRPPGAWEEIRFFDGGGTVGGLWETRFPPAFLVYLLMNDLVEDPRRESDPSYQQRLPYLALVAFLRQQAGWSGRGAFQFQILQRIPSPGGAGMPSAPAATLYRSPEVHASRTSHES